MSEFVKHMHEPCQKVIFYTSGNIRLKRPIRNFDSYLVSEVIDKL